MSPAYRFVCLMWLAVLPAAATGEKRVADPWKKAGADAGLRRAFERAIYRLEASGGGYRGVNPAQRLELEFNARGARLKASDPRVDVELRLTAYGYGPHLRTPAPTKLAGAGPRVEYQRGAITEWYVNESRGVEQGFTLAQRPGTACEGEPLVIALGFSGRLQPVLAAGGDAVLLQAGKQTVLRYAGLQARDARGREVASRLEVRAQEVWLVIEDTSAEYPLVVDPIVTWNQEAELTASDETAGDAFATTVSVDGNTAVVTAPGHNSSQGAAYVFVLSGGTWIQQAELTASDGAATYQFGSSVSVSGDTVVVGNNVINAAYIFVRSGTTWSQQAKLPAPDAEAVNFGLSVAVSGDTVVVGARDATVNFVAGEGAAYVFVRSGTTWSQQAKLTPSVAGQQGFGVSVAVDGGTAVVGAYLEPIGGPNNGEGAAYVFVRTGTTWSQQAELLPSDGVPLEEFGFSVAVSGAIAVVGTGGNAAYVFVQNGGSWSQQAELTPSGTAANFGSSVAVSGTTVVVGAYLTSFSSHSGSAYVFVQSGGSWSQEAELAPSDAAHWFGASVSVAGNTIVVGAPQGNQSSLSGTAYVFLREGTAAQLVVTQQPSTGTVGSAIGDVVVQVEDAGGNLVSGSNATVTMTSTPTDVGGVLNMNAVGGIATFSDLVFNAAGSYILTASSTGLTPATSTSIQISQASQIITFGTLSNQTYGTAPFMVSATASSGLAVNFASTTTAVCTMSGNTVTLVAVGTCTIQATQPGNTTYAPATPVNQSFQVKQASQTITFGALPNQVNGTAPFAVSATASSGLTVSFASTTTSICTVSGNIVTLVTVGQCTIQANQPGNTDYAAATPVNQSFQVTPPGGAKQTIAFRPLSDQVLGAAPFTISATASSGLPVSFASTTTSICVVSGNTVTLMTAGTCTIEATQPGSLTYAAAKPVDRSFRVTQASQTINFGALSNQILGTAPFTVSATASSGLPVSFASTTTSICVVSGNTVTLVTAGTCTIEATQPGNLTYAVAMPLDRSFQVTQGALYAASETTTDASGHHRLWEIDPATSGLVRQTSVTLPGNGIGIFYNVGGLAFDGQGNLWAISKGAIDASGDYRLWEINPANSGLVRQTLVSLPGNGVGTFYTIGGLAFGGPHGNLWAISAGAVDASGDYRLWEINPANGGLVRQTLVSLPGNGVGTFYNVGGLTFGQGGSHLLAISEVAIDASGHHPLWEINPANSGLIRQTLVTLPGNGIGIFYNVGGLAFAQGNLWAISEGAVDASGDYRLWEINPTNGGLIRQTSVSLPGNGIGTFYTVGGLAWQ